MDAGDANYTTSATVAGSVGDNIIGSTTAGNFLGGSIGNDVLTANNNAPNTIFTDGGADTVNLGAGHTAVNHIGIYAGFPTPPFLGGSEIVQSGSITQGNDVAQLGWWGLATGATESGYYFVGPDLFYATVAPNQGTSADAVTINNFLATDVIDLSSSLSNAWGSGLGNGIGGTAKGLVEGDLLAFGGNTGSVQMIIGHAGAADANNTVKAGTNIIELTAFPFSGPTDVAAYLHNSATNVALSAALGGGDSTHMIVVYSDFADGKTHVADLALFKGGAASVNTSDITEHVSDLAIVGTALDATAHAIHFV
jgi:hypothetical protein